MHLKPLSIYETADYFRELSSLINKAVPGNRVGLMTMSFEPSEPHIHKLMTELVAAARRGVQVYLLVDAMAFTTNKHDIPNGPNMLRQSPTAVRRPYFRQKLQALQELQASGGQYRIINQYAKRFINPYAGRSHIKIAIIDNVTFAGGCNLGQIQIDYMVRSEDSVVADWLYQLIQDTAKDGMVGRVLKYSDQTIDVDAQTKLFVDAGKRKQSLIYENALELIDSAQQWLVMTCQFFPNTVTAEHLAAAVRRGVDVALYYNHPRHHAAHMRPLQRGVILLERTHQPAILFKHQLPKNLRRLHAKLIACEHGAMVGSHNYVTHGVNFGTAEIAIRRDDPAFAREIVNSLKQNLPLSHAD